MDGSADWTLDLSPSPSLRRTTSSPLGGSAVTFKYNPHQMCPTEVLETFVGREEVRDRLLSHLRAQRGSASPRHVFLYGPRGIGKTTLLLVLKHSLEASPGLQEAFEVVQFSEEERRIVNLPSFAIRTLELWDQARGAGQGDPIRENLERARKDPEGAFDLLLAAGGELDGKQVVLLIDNFDEAVAAMVSGKGRRFGGTSAERIAQFDRLLASPGFVVVATALQSPAKRRDFPSELLARFLPPEQLEPLPDALTFLRRRAARDRRESFLESLPRFAARIEGLNRLADGNPRLLAFLYDCLGERPFLDLVEIVQRTVDDLTPMYQDVLERLLNRGQAAVLEMLAENGGVGRAKEIAELTYQDEQTVRTFLNDLSDLGLVVRHDDLRLPGMKDVATGRETIFRIHPPLFQIWYEMRHLHKESGLFLLRFFTLLADAEEARQMLGEFDGSVTEQAGPRSLIEGVLDILDPFWEDIRKEHVDKILARGGTLREALDSLSLAIEDARSQDRPSRIGLFATRSNIKQGLGDFVGAERDLDEAEALLEAAPSLEQRVKLHIARTSLNLALDRLPEAVAEGEKAVAASIGLTSASSTELRALAAAALAETLNALGESSKARDLVLQASDSFDEKSSTALKLIGASLMGRLHQSLGDLTAAQSCFERAVEISRSSGSPRREASVLSRLGWNQHLLGNQSRAKELCERALALTQKIGSPEQEAEALNGLGSIHASLGEYDHARKHYETALAIHNRIGSRRDAAGLLNNLGTIYQKIGDRDQARLAYRKLLVVSREVGDRPSEIVALINLGSLHNDLEEYEQAEELFQRALVLVRQSGNRLQEGMLLSNLGNMYSAVGLSEKAFGCLEQALGMAREGGFRAVEAMSLNNLGSEYLKREEHTKARECLTLALSIAESLGEPHSRARTLGNLAVLAWKEGRSEESLGFLERARLIFLDLGERPALTRASSQIVAALFHLGLQSRVTVESALDQALARVREIGVSSFLSLFVAEAAVPGANQSPETASRLLSWVRRLRAHSAFAEAITEIGALETFLRFYAEGRSAEVLKELGPTEIFLVGSLIDRVERPDHAKARELIRQGDPAAARSILERILDRVPEDSEALFNLALVLIDQGELEKARKRLELLLALDPGITEAHRILGEIELQCGNTDAAVSHLRHYVEKDPSNSGVFRQLASLLRQSDRFDELVEVLRLWQKHMDERDAACLEIWIVEAHLLTGQIDRAQAELPPEGFSGGEPQERVLLGLLRTLFDLRAGDAETARRHAAELLRYVTGLPPGQVPDPVTPELIAKAQELLGEREVRFFVALTLAVRQQVPPEQVPDLLSEADVEEIRRLVAEEGELALEALRNGKVQSFADFFKLSTRSLGPRASLAALGDAFPGLPPVQQTVALKILCEALPSPQAVDMAAALGALGKNFARLTPDQRPRGLRAILDLIEQPDTISLSRERALSLLNVLYPNLEPAERQEVRRRLEEVKSRVESPALREILQETIPATESERP